MSKLAVAVAVALASSRVYALGLGEIDLHSALNEPLNADVRLLAAKPGELDNATVHLAPDAEFTRAGIERPAVLSDLNFTIVPGKDGTATLKITSTKPIREPFLDFIVQLSWQAGRLMREYTLLLDPPVFSEDKKAPVSAPVAQAASEQQPAPAATPTAPMPMASSSAQAPTPAAVPSPAPQSVAAGTVNVHQPKLKLEKGQMTYGPVQRNDTLWKIASSLRPDDSVSVYQMMLALVKENPQAFYDNNVNGLKAGYVLRLPDKSAALAIDEVQAERETAQQDRQWQQAHGGASSTGGGGSAAPAKSPESKAQPSGAAGQEKEGARLRLVAPGDVTSNAAGAGGDVQKELDKLRGQLAIATESSDTAKRESDELRSRVATLENQITSMQKLLTLKDQALNDLQKRSGMTATPPKEQTAAPQMAVPSVAPAKPAPAKPAPVQPAAPKKQQAPDIFSDTTLMAEIAGGAVLLLAVLWLIVRRRRNEEQMEPVDGGEAMDAMSVEEAPSAEEEALHSVAEEELGGLGGTQQMTEVAEEAAHDAEEDIPETADDLDMLHTPEGDIDPIVEADVYLAYRRYQQAEALIQNALEQQPNQQDLQAKLLEIYYAAKNVDAFQNMAEKLYANLGDNPNSDVWQRILPMGRELCPEHPLFNPSAGTGGRGVDAAHGSVDDTLAGAMENTDTGTASALGEESFDLDLGGQSAGVELTTEHETAVGAAQEDKMEFDLNLGGESAALTEQAPVEETPESLSAALDFADQAPANEVTEPKAAEAAAQPAQPAEAVKDDSWEIEPAMSDFGNIDFGLDDSDLLAGTDVVGTKLDLARAYIDMGDNDSARDILTEVIEEGNPQQKQEAEGLVEKIA